MSQTKDRRNTDKQTRARLMALRAIAADALLRPAEVQPEAMNVIYELTDRWIMELCDI